MRDLHELDEYRRKHPHYPGVGDAGNGYFEVPNEGGTLRIIASNGLDWDHVSVSMKHRCPTWQEMDRVARLFFKEHETCVQYHVPRSDHVNQHPYCLHLWRPRRGKPMPRPPASMVGAV